MAFEMMQDNVYLSFFTALMIYLDNAITASNIDYLDEQIKILKGEDITTNI